MNTAEMLGKLFGGIGLFLLGMWLMTEGLKKAAGPAIQAILVKATQTRARALASGILLTALVQSSSAVTVAAIGFVNAGLLTLGQALWVLFGANVGTTMTGWLVASVGMGVKVEAAALPLVGAGMLLHLGGRTPRQAAVGLTLVGFGILFLGIDTLKMAFLGVASAYVLPSADGLAGVLLHLFAGLMLTVLMQSSSAALAVALTAAQGGLLALEPAAAVVIGANLGTTVTALIAAAGATVNARRAALAHVLFNAVTAVVALLILPWLLRGVLAMSQLLALAPEHGTSLALFHTLFNMLGVILMWPLTGRLTAFLQARFRSDEEDLARPRHLDDNLTAMPEMAVRALASELERMGALTVDLLRRAIAGEPADQLSSHAQALATLKVEVDRYVGGLSRTAMTPDASGKLAALLRILRYYASAAEITQAIGAPDVAGAGCASAAAAPMGQWQAHAEQLCDMMFRGGTPDLEALEDGMRNLEDEYQALKIELLRRGANGTLDLASMDAQLQSSSLVRRALQQIAKAARMQGQADKDTAGAEGLGAYPSR